MSADGSIAGGAFRGGALPALCATSAFSGTPKSKKEAGVVRAVNTGGAAVPSSVEVLVRADVSEDC